MNNYVSKVLSRIAGKSTKKQIELELQAHLADRTDYYINAGYDAETAAQKAEEHMGNTAELVGDRLNSIDNSDLGAWVSFIFFFVNSIAWAANIFLWFAGEPDTLRNMDILFLLISSVYLLLICANLLAAIKVKRKFLAFSAFVMLCFYGVWQGNVPFIFCLSQIFTGKAAGLGELFVHTFQINQHFLFIVGNVFLALLAFVIVLIFIHIFRFNKLKNGKNAYKAEKAFIILLSVLFAIIFAVTAYTYIAEKNADDGFSNKPDVQGFYLIESDEMVNPETIEDYDDKSIFYDAELWSSEFLTSECKKYKEEQADFSNEKYSDDYWLDYWNNYPIQMVYNSNFAVQYEDMNQDVSYLLDKLCATLYTNKRYVMIVPMLWDRELNYYPDFSDSDAQWIEVTDHTTVVSEERHYSCCGSYVEYYIEIYNSDLYEIYAP